MDINAPRLDRIRIGNEEFAIWQNIYYEDLPLYCSFCKHLGHEIERCFWKNTTGSKVRTHMEDEGVKIMQDKKKGKTVWVEKHSGDFSFGEEGKGEIGDCSKGNTELLEEKKKHDMKIQMETTKEEEGVISDKEFPAQVNQITEEPQSEVNQEDHHTRYFDCLKEKVEEKSDLLLINHEFQMTEEIKSGDILIDQIFVDMGEWKNMDKAETTHDRAEISHSLSDTETIKPQNSMTDDEGNIQIKHHKKSKKSAIRSPIRSNLYLSKPNGLKLRILSRLVYAKCSVTSRRDLWNALIQSAEKLDMPWLIGGDFNAILNRDERVGGNSPDRRSMEDFNSMILECGVEEVSCNNQFTWSNGRMWEKLDRILVNYQWSAAFDGFKTEALNRDTSDHCPILIQCSPLSTTPKSSFRFQSMWCQHDKFLEMIKQNWDTPLSPYSKGLFGFFYKLKRLKSALRRWNKEVFGNIFDEIKKAEKEALDNERNYDSLQSPEARTEVNRSYANLNKLLSQEEAFWRQKSGIKWLREGDRNSKFFHAVAKKNRSKNQINQIRDSEGRLIHNEAEIQNSALAYFQSILTKEPTEDGRVLLESIPNIISSEDNRNLNAVPTAEEIKGTVFSLNKDSAAGPDGFSALFYQHCWDIIQHNLCEAIVDFFDGKIIPTGIAATSIILIPKKDKAEEWKDFRPISLCNVVNKIITKLLASRLNTFLPKIISPSQSGFTPGRDIGDNILLAQELVYQLDRKTRGGNVVLKLDMAKAYDRVDWTFLLKVLQSFGFDHDWLDKIERCINNCGFSIVFNGELKGFFKSSRGLRQGDPISPSLFIILAESFSRGLDRLFARHSYLDYIYGGGVPMSHLAFADDMIIFTNGQRNSLAKVMEFIKIYSSGSGQNINCSKSSFTVTKE
ncbi:Uncharacterized protein Adt_36259 [Abeliophyllum distichum]|uniref:Reverse transcriptase domain-containing protein n=1 Tax=Abeliophyllum distichum TaxID=126358 RepID=A0ABD1QIZ4_9LAMI